MASCTLGLASARPVVAWRLILEQIDNLACHRLNLVITTEHERIVCTSSYREIVKPRRAVGNTPERDA